MMLRTLDPDERRTTARFVLQLRDGFTGNANSVGELTARLLKGKIEMPIVPLHKQPDATFVFSEVPPGDYAIEVRSNADALPSEPAASLSPAKSLLRRDAAFPPEPAFYSRIGIPIKISNDDPVVAESGKPPVWPGFPNIALADRELPLDAATQRIEYRRQRDKATLRPTTTYPFPTNATLVRGMVLNGKLPLAGALVRRRPWSDVPGNSYTTGEDGEFVIFLLEFPQPPKPKPPKWQPAIKVTTTHPDFQWRNTSVPVLRGRTVAANIQMKP